MRTFFFPASFSEKSIGIFFPPPVNSSTISDEKTFLSNASTSPSVILKTEDFLCYYIHKGSSYIKNKVHKL